MRGKKTMTTYRASELLPILYDGKAKDISPAWQARLIEALERVIDLEQWRARVQSGDQPAVIALEEIRELASWHYDPEAEPNDSRPEDMVAHINGLIVKLCDEVLGEQDGDV